MSPSHTQWEEITQRKEYQEAGIMGNLRVWSTGFFVFCFLFFWSTDFNKILKNRELSTYDTFMFLSSTAVPLHLSCTLCWPLNAFPQSSFNKIQVVKTMPANSQGKFLFWDNFPEIEVKFRWYPPTKALF